MAASKKAITRRWLNTESLTVNQWEAIIKDIQTMELLTFRLRLQRDKGEPVFGLSALGYKREEDLHPS